MLLKSIPIKKSKEFIKSVILISKLVFMIWILIAVLVLIIICFAVEMRKFLL